MFGHGRPWIRAGSLWRVIVRWSLVATVVIGVTSVSAFGEPAAGASGQSGFTELSAGYHTTCGVTSTHRAYCWGTNTYGQLGNGTVTKETAPAEVLKGAGPSSTGTYLSTIAQVSEGQNTTCAVSTTKYVYCWGHNNKGQLGSGTKTTSSVPVEVVKGAGPSATGTYLSTMTEVSTGTQSLGTCAVSTAKTVYCWGTNFSGQLGNGTTTTSIIPVEVLKGAGPSATGTHLTTVTEVSIGYHTVCALSTEKTVYCWGINNVGQLGNGTTTTSTTPVEVLKGAGPSATGTYLTTITEVTEGGYDATCAVTTSGHAFCWGDNFGDKLGVTTTVTINEETTPAEVLKGTGPSATGTYLTTVTGISEGYNTTCSAMSTDHAYCWGKNIYGQFGNGTTTTSDTPVEVLKGTGPSATGTYLTTVTGVSEGNYATYALVTSGSAYACGTNAYGQLGDGTTTASSTPVRVAITFPPPPPTVEAPSAVSWSLTLSGENATASSTISVKVTDTTSSQAWTLEATLPSAPSYGTHTLGAVTAKCGSQSAVTLTTSPVTVCTGPGTTESITLSVFVPANAYADSYTATIGWEVVT